MNSYPEEVDKKRITELDSESDILIVSYIHWLGIELLLKNYLYVRYFECLSKDVRLNTSICGYYEKNSTPFSK